MFVSNEFENLPLSQVEVKLTLPKAVVLHTHNLLASAASMSDHYRAVQPDAELTPPPGMAELPQLPNAVQYVRFIDPDKSMTATLHTQMVSVGWADFGNDHPYPRFQAMLDELQWVLTNWPITKDIPEYPVAQIVYVNFIPDTQGEGLWFLNKKAVSLQLSEQVSFGQFEWCFRTEQADVRISVSEASKVTEGEPIQGFLFETVVGSNHKFGHWKEALAYCHNQSNTIFSSMISEEAKDKWGLIK